MCPRLAIGTSFRLAQATGNTGGLMETKMSEQANTGLAADQLVPLDGGDILQLEMQAWSQEKAEAFREPKRRFTPGLRAAKRRWRFAFGRYKR